MTNSWWRRFLRSKEETYKFSLIGISSRDSDLFFDVSCIVKWRRRKRDEVHRDPCSVVRAHLRSAVESAADGRQVTESSALQDDLNASLGMPITISDTGVDIVWAHVVVSADPISTSVALHRAQHQRELRAQEEDEERQIRRIEAFRRRVLSKPDMALTFHFLENPGSADEASLQAFENLSRKLARYDRDGYWMQISDIVLAFVQDLTAAERRDSINALAVWFDRYERSDFKRRLVALEGNGTRREESVMRID